MTTARLMIKPMFRMACAVLFSLTALAAGAADGGGDATGAQNNIEKISYSALQGGKIEVKVTLKKPLSSPPAGFTTNNPPRIALDFPGTGNALGKNSMEVGEGTLRTLNIVQAGNRTRLVMNLTKPVGYETRLEENNLIIALQGAAAVASTTNETTRFAESGAGAQKHTVNDIDFRRGSNGEGRVVVGLSDSTTGIDIRKQGKNLVVDFIDAAIPASQERKLDVADFGTPVRMLSTASQGKNVRMVIEPQGQWEYSAYQADRQFIVDVKKIVEDPNKMVPGSKQGYGGEKLSLNFQNVEVRTVLQVIADFTNLNIITSDSVSGSLTLRLKDVPWDQALDIILNAKGLDKRKNGNVVWIAPRDELAVKEKAELEAKQQISELEPLQTEYYALNYLRADRAKQMLSGESGTLMDSAGDATCAPAATGLKSVTPSAGGGSGVGAGGGTSSAQRILSKRGSASFDLKTNMLVVNDIPSKHEEIRRLMNVIDVPAKQVMIEARVVLANDTFGKQLGVRLGGQLSGSAGNNRLGMSQNLENSTIIANNYPPSWVSGPITGTVSSTGVVTERYTPSSILSGIGNSNVNLGVSNPAGALAFTLMNLGTGNLISLELSALEADGRGNVISNPRVMTSNQRPAAIVQGVQIPVVTPGSANNPATTTFKDVLLCLLVNPQVLNNDSILLDVEVTKDTPGDFTPDGNNRAVNISRVKTQVLVNNGETAVLGGIFTQATQNDVQKVPLFGDLPVIGNLFRHTQKTDEKRELMIFITPRILKESLNIQ
ncbi:MAG: type IV pilus secretin PilQ [Nitrosomonadales bacterium]|nr:MAG: type IV pilus secretin PilQ [Nitrosomonadales bacterium]